MIKWKREAGEKTAGRFGESFGQLCPPLRKLAVNGRRKPAVFPVIKDQPPRTEVANYGDSSLNSVIMVNHALL